MPTKPADMKRPTLGVHLLETITKGMYSEPLDCVREYIQNAYDSIRAERRNGGLAADKGEVKVVVDKANKTVRIVDDGRGLEPEEAATYLLDLGASEKAETQDKAKENAGFRGIGRMAGITYCDTLKFSTSRGYDIKTVIRFDARQLRKLTRAGQTPTTIIDAIGKNVDVSEEPNESGNRFFEVALEGINDCSFLNPERLNEYLGEVAPVAFDPQQWRFGEKIMKIARERNFQESLGHIAISIVNSDGEVLYDVRRPHKNTLTNNAKIMGVEPLPLDGTHPSEWWGWLAVHSRSAQLKDSFSGVRLRMHNIQIGDDKTFARFFEGSNVRFNKWCIGEIHIIDPNVVPNTRRDYFESTHEWKFVRAQLADNAKAIEKKIRFESKDRNEDPARVLRETKRILVDVSGHMEVGFDSRDGRDEQINTLTEQGEKLNALEKKLKKSKLETYVDQIAKAKEDVERQKQELRAISRFQSDDAVAHLDKKSRRVVKIIEKVLKESLKKEVFADIRVKIYEALQPGNRK